MDKDLIIQNQQKEIEQLKSQLKVATLLINHHVKEREQYDMRMRERSNVPRTSNSTPLEPTGIPGDVRKMHTGIHRRGRTSIGD